ncbi:MAG: WD40 repeat domain-containing protein [Prochloraceae cyanobacterium]|nr:WD40 repeat domain-containing protein [Prochloraceae cyanobacterium]
MKQEDKNSQHQYQRKGSSPFREIRARLSDKPGKEDYLNEENQVQQVNLAKYERFYLSLISQQYPLSADRERQLQKLQQDLKLTPPEAEKVELKVLNSFPSITRRDEFDLTKKGLIAKNNSQNCERSQSKSRWLNIWTALILLSIGPIIFSLFLFPNSVRLPTGKQNIQNTVEKLPHYVKSAALSKFLTREAKLINSFAIALQGERIVIGGRHGQIIIGNVVTGNLIASFQDESKIDINAIVITPDGNKIITANERGRIKIWDAKKQKAIHTFAGHSPFSIESIAISSDGKMLASGDIAGNIKVWDVERKEIIHTLLGHSATINSLEISRDGKNLVSGSNDTTVKFWNALTGQLVNTIKENSEVFAVTISPQSDKIISGDRTGEIGIWNAQTGKKIKLYQQQSQKISSLDINPQGNILVSGSNDRTVVVWNLESGQHKQLNEKQTEYINHVAISGNKRIIISSSKHEIQVWQTYDPIKIE